uniref:Putative secreted protein n=1 Tax=Anopheles marajoara TaxID=58244 RepID=A0A2M4CER8_9DIPT
MRTLRFFLASPEVLANPLSLLRCFGSDSSQAYPDLDTLFHTDFRRVSDFRSHYTRSPHTLISTCAPLIT